MHVKQRYPGTAVPDTQKGKIMDDAMRQKIALFRFSVIAPLVNDTFEAPSKEAFYRHLAGKEYNLPDGKQVRFAADTIKSWFLSYMRNGMDALIPKGRSDMGRSRALTDLAINQIHELKEKYTIPNLDYINWIK